MYFAACITVHSVKALFNHFGSFSKFNDYFTNLVVNGLSECRITLSLQEGNKQILHYM